MTATEAMLQAMDQLVLGELKKRVPRLARIKDRTDPMLAVYPGGGARFQKHVDNTARDGRRLTVHK
jgi:hypoxia-inducible factor (prolyl hydroxylase)